MAKPEDGVDEALIDVIYAAADEPDRWADVLVGIENAFGCVASSFLGQERGSDIGVGAVTGHDHAAIASWQADFSHLNPWLRPEVGRRDGLILTEAHLDIGKAAHERFERGYYYNEWVRPQGIRHTIGCALSIGDGGFLLVNNWRPTSAGAFTPEDIARYEAMSRHLARATQMSFKIARLRRDLAVAQATGSAPAGVLVLDAHGHVVEMNAEGARIVEDGKGIALRGGRLRTADGRGGSAIERLLDAARRPGIVGGGVFGPIQVARPVGRPLAVEVMAMPAATALFPWACEARTVLLVTDPDRAAQRSGNRLGALDMGFDLTPAEARIGAALLEAPNLREAARALGIGYETARSQIRSVFSKTGTRSQVELVRLLSRRPG